MSGIIKRGARWMVRGLIMAFLIVALTQVLIYLHLLGESFPEKVLITFISLIVASILLWIVTRPEMTVKVR